MNKKLSIIILLSCVGNIFSMNIGNSEAITESDRQKLSVLFGSSTRRPVPSALGIPARCSVEPVSSQEMKEVYQHLFGGKLDDQSNSHLAVLPETCQGVSASCSLGKNISDNRFLLANSSDDEELGNDISDNASHVVCQLDDEAHASFLVRNLPNISFDDSLNPISACNVSPASSYSENPKRANVTVADLLKLREEVYKKTYGEYQSQVESGCKPVLPVIVKSLFERETAKRNALEAKTQANIELDSAKNEYKEALKTVQEFNEALETNTTNGLSKQTFGAQFIEAEQKAAALKEKAITVTALLKKANADLEQAKGGAFRYRGL
jgi:hypothetical protein